MQLPPRYQVRVTCEFRTPAPTDLPSREQGAAAPHPAGCLQLPNLSMSLSVLPGPVGVNDPRAHSEVVPGIKVRSAADATKPAWPGTAVRVSRPPAKWTKL